MTGIIGAMDSEVSTLISMLEDAQRHDFGTLAVYTGKLLGKEVAVTKSGIGKSASAAAAAVLITVFGADSIINTGIAGGLEKDLKRGEIVVADRTCFHDFYTGPLEGLNQVVECDQANIERVLRIAEKNGMPARKGLIVSGDEFVCTDERSADIYSRYKAAAVEMEGASIASVSKMLGVPCTIVRSISDSADDDAPDDAVTFETFAAENAVKIVCGLVAEE